MAARRKKAVRIGKGMKESAKIEVRELPQFPQLKAWRLALLEAILACANVSDSRELIKWYQMVLHHGLG